MQSAVRSEHRAAGLVAPQPVAVVVHRAGRDDAARLCARHGRTVTLPRHRRSVGIGADRVAEPRAVLDDARGIVLGEDPEVERRERALRSRRRGASRTRRDTARERATRRPRRHSSGRAFQKFARALQQLVLRVQRRVVHDVVQQRLQRMPELGPGREAELDRSRRRRRGRARRCGLACSCSSSRRKRSSASRSAIGGSARRCASRGSRPPCGRSARRRARRRTSRGNAAHAARRRCRC